MASVEDLQQEDYLKNDNNRLSAEIQQELVNMRDPDDIMTELMGILTDIEVAPSVGRYYTFIYSAKTPLIEYDEFPLIACVGVYPWGFRGLNYHWNDFHNYTWEEVVGLLHVVRDSEFSDMRSIPYQKFKLNT